MQLPALIFTKVWKSCKYGIVVTSVPSQNIKIIKISNNKYNIELNFKAWH